jgi:hypothetical protein
MTQNGLPGATAGSFWARDGVRRGRGREITGMHHEVAQIVRRQQPRQNVGPPQPIQL